MPVPRSTNGRVDGDLRWIGGLVHQCLVVNSRGLVRKWGTWPRPFERVQARDDRCYCADNSIPRVSMVILEHRPGITAINRGRHRRLKCLNTTDNTIEVLLYPCACLGMALLDNILNKLEVKLTSGVHLAIIQATRHRFLQLRAEQRVSIEPGPSLAPASNRSAPLLTKGIQLALKKRLEPLFVLL